LLHVPLRLLAPLLLEHLALLAARLLQQRHLREGLDDDLVLDAPLALLGQRAAPALLALPHEGLLVDAPTRLPDARATLLACEASQRGVFERG
jgi:hypothetical protein